jgi:hypothetical protein
MYQRKYRLIDIARQIDRDKSTLIRWEEMGLIPTAARDSRGWRYYTEEQVKEIVRRVHETDYFRKSSDSNGVTYTATQPKMVYLG